MPSVNIVIPMKDPTLSKQRLAPVMNPRERKDLALFFFNQTLTFFRTHFNDYSILVVTSSERIERLARAQGAAVLKEGADQGLTEAVARAAEWSRARGFQSQLYIPADIARLDIAEVRALLRNEGANPAVVVCPAQDDGTNALLTTPPDVIPFRFGRRSSLKHQAEAQLKQIPCYSLHLPYLTFDVDTPADLFEYEEGQTYWSREVIG